MKNFFKKLLEPFIKVIIADEVKKEIDARLTEEKKNKIIEPNVFEFFNKNLRIRVKRPEDKDWKKYYFSRPLKEIEGNESVLIAEYPNNFNGAMSEQDREICKKFLTTDMLIRVYIESFCIQVQKSPALDWGSVDPKMIEIIASLFEEVQ